MEVNKNDKILETLKKIRKAHNISSKDMAEKLGISKAFYCQIERGSRKLSYIMAIKISEILKSKPDKIFFDDFKTL